MSAQTFFEGARRYAQDMPKEYRLNRGAKGNAESPAADASARPAVLMCSYYCLKNLLFSNTISTGLKECLDSAYAYIARLFLFLMLLFAE